MSKLADYTKMTRDEIKAACGDDARKWADAFFAFLKADIPGLSLGDFANIWQYFEDAIETAHEVRAERRRQRGTE